MLPLVIIGCAVWLGVAAGKHDEGLALSIMLTLCFGLNAVLLSFGRSRVSAGTVAMSVGAVAWGAVWASGALLEHFAPAAVVSPELWNLPKYVVAAGMLLTLLEEEIRSAELASEHYRLLFAGNPHPMWMYDPETLRLLQVNEAAIAHYGFTPEDMGSMTVRRRVRRGRAYAGVARQAATGATAAAFGTMGASVSARIDV